MIVDVEELITSNLYDVYVCRTFPVFPSDYHVCIVTLCKTSIVKYVDFFIFKALNINWISLAILFWIPNCTYMIVNVEELITSNLYDVYVCRTFPVFPSDYHVCIVTLCKTSIVKYVDFFIFKALNINWISLAILFWIPNCTYMIVNVEEPIISYLYDG